MLPGKYRRLLSQMEELKWQITNNILSQVQILEFQEFKYVVFLCDGPINSPYEGFWFRIKVQWPEDYPFRAPRCVFLDKIWNPYVDFETGQICMDILAKQNLVQDFFFGSRGLTFEYLQDSALKSYFQNQIWDQITNITIDIHRQHERIRR